MRRRTLILRLVAPLALVIALALVAATVDSSGATFTTSSQTTVAAKAEAVSSWISLWSQTTDPGGLTGYATQRVQSGVAPLCASGSNETLTVAVGGIRSNGTSYTFTRAFTLEGNIPFPDPAMTTVNVAYSLVADPSTNLQPINSVTFTGVNGSTRKYGVNLVMRTTGTGWVTGRTYTPMVRLTMTFTGSPTAYYVYDVPVAVTIVNW